MERPKAPDFLLQLDGVLPRRRGDARTIKAETRERILHGLLRQLNEGERIEFRFSRDNGNKLNWSISGWQSHRQDQETDVALETLVHASLGGLRSAYRFSPTAVRHVGVDRKWTTRVSPVAQCLKLPSRSLGFQVPHAETDAQVRMAVPTLSSDGRMFESLVQLVLAAPLPLALRVACQTIRLSEVDRQHLGSCLGALNRMSVDRSSKHSIERACSLIETWLQAGHGVRISSVVSANSSVPTSFLALIGAEIFGCECASRGGCQEDTFALDLGDCLPFGARMPELFPGPEAFDEARPARVFNVCLPPIPQCGPTLGTVCAGGKKVRVALPEEGRSRHTYIVGATGTGKSTLLGNLLQHDMKAGHGIALIDPHGDLFNHVLETVPKTRAEDVVLIDPAYSDEIPGINFLDIPEGPGRRLQVNFVITEFLSMFNQLYDMRECGGPQFELYFRNAMLLLIESRCPHATILDLARVFNDKDFRSELCVHCQNPQVVEFWRKTAERTVGEQSLANWTAYVTSKLNHFTHSGPIRPIIGQSRTTVDFRKLLDGRGILLVNLSKGLLGELDTRMLGMLLIGQLFSAALARACLPAHERTPFHLYVDEFQNFVTDGVASLVAEARKFGLHLTIANQTLAQLSAHAGRHNVLDSILGNVGNMIVFRVGVPDTDRLAMFTEPDLPREELQRLPNFHAFARLLTNQGPVDPFVFKSNAAGARPAQHEKVRARILGNQSRWSKSIAEIESEIHQRLRAESRWSSRPNRTDDSRMSHEIAGIDAPAGPLPVAKAS